MASSQKTSHENPQQAVECYIEGFITEVLHREYLNLSNDLDLDTLTERIDQTFFNNKLTACLASKLAIESKIVTVQDRHGNHPPASLDHEMTMSDIKLPTIPVSAQSIKPSQVIKIQAISSGQSQTLPVASQPKPIILVAQSPTKPTNKIIKIANSSSLVLNPGATTACSLGAPKANLIYSSLPPATSATTILNEIKTDVNINRSPLKSANFISNQQLNYNAVINISQLQSQLKPSELVKEGGPVSAQTAFSQGSLAVNGSGQVLNLVLVSEPTTGNEPCFLPIV